MKQKNLLKIAFSFILAFSFSTISAQIYDADFSTNGDGFADHTSASPPADAPASVGPFGSAGNQWSLSYTSKPGTDGSANSFKVVDGALLSDDWGGQGIFKSQSIDVSSINTVDISAISQNSGANDDNFTYFYILDGGSRVETPIGETNNGDPVSYSISGLDVSGVNSLVVGFEFSENGAGDGYSTSSFTVSESGGTPSPTITFDSASSAETETDATFATSGIPITLTNYDADVTITATVNGSSTAEPGDYTIDLTALVFDANETLNIPLSINDDADFEDETIIIDFTVTSGTADLGISTHTVTITDNDTPPAPSLIISEVADTGDNDNARFVEIYNNGSVDIDFSVTPIYISRFTNGNATATASNVEELTTGTLTAGQYLVIASSGTNFTTAYGFSSDEINGGFGVNGDDPFGMYSGTYPSGTLFDVYGEIGVDGTGQSWEYEDSRAVRNNIMEAPSTTWQASSWTITSANVADATPGASENEFRYDGDWKPRDISNATSSDNVLITSAITLSTNLEINNFEVDNSATVTINSGVALKVNGTSTGNVTYNRALTANQWHLIASPVNSQGIANFYTNEPNTRLGSGVGVAQNVAIATYDNSQVDANDVWSYYTFGQVDGLNGDDTNNTFANGTGYSVSLSTSEDVSFTGTIPTSNQSFILAHGGANNFNLVGNSFTSFFTLGDFYGAGSNNSIIGTDFYFWNGSQYVTRTSGGNATFEIAPGQGFFVESLSAGTISFEAADLITGNGDTFNKSLDSKLEITLNVFEGKNKRFANIIYSDKATSGYDKGYDGKLFGGVPHSFAIYSDLIESDGKKYQVQSLPSVDYENMIVPVGIIADTGKEITFTAEALNLPTNLKVFLEDRQTNTFTRLDEANSEYTITTTEKLEDIGRFYLHTKSNSTLSTTDALLESVRIYKTDVTTLRIAGLSQGTTNIELFNTLGKKVLNTSFSTSTGIKDISLPNFASGIYIVKLSTATGQLNKKITLE
ncbi:lamin tail domain-containing protein [Polaribacter sp. R77954]|uniref:lamin tail domain-containing protein n=1 Tax=Polaribacter sp. R77954 TaxID=3093870 RepID=UPI0037CA62EF